MNGYRWQIQVFDQKHQRWDITTLYPDGEKFYNYARSQVIRERAEGELVLLTDIKSGSLVHI